MTFAERPPSDRWAALRYKGEVLAEAWFKPDGDPIALVFRVPRDPAGRPDDPRRRLTLGDLLKAVGVPADEVAGWRFGDDPADAPTDPDPDLTRPLPPPPPGAPHLTVRVRVNPPPAAATPAAPDDIPPETWQDLDARWRAVLAIETAIANTRQGVEAVRAELEGACRASLSGDAKVHALGSDVAQWNRAKSRAHYTLPKLREYIHRATWAAASADRKRLDEVVRAHIEPRVPFPDVHRVREQMDHLLKDRQVLATQGTAVYQEGRGLASELQRCLATIQRNAADRARARQGKGR